MLVGAPNCILQVVLVGDDTHGLVGIVRELSEASIDPLQTIFSFKPTSAPVLDHGMIMQRAILNLTLVFSVDRHRKTVEIGP